MKYGANTFASVFFQCYVTASIIMFNSIYIVAVKNIKHLGIRAANILKTYSIKTVSITFNNSNVKLSLQIVKYTNQLDMMSRDYR